MKIALVSAQRPSSWISCRSITENLRRAYEIIFPGSTQSFYLNPEDSSYEIHKEVLRLREFLPDVVAFIDHSPHPHVFLTSLDASFPDAPPKIIIHVFGDFTLHAPKWQAIEPALRRLNPFFVCASKKQETLIRNFLNGPSPGTVWIPFPVEKKTFRFDSALRKTTRKALGSSDDEFIFLYAGRLSLQKNILQLIQAFAAFSEHMNPRARLMLAGPIDDIGVPYIRKFYVKGSYATALLSTIETCLPAQRRDRVSYLGDLGAEELSRCYGLCDSFVSLSTHNDEDFGMAPAEALSCGAPVVLADWGGYSGFELIAGGAPAARLVPVAMKKDSVAPDFRKSVQALTLAASTCLSEAQRDELSRKAQGRLSCESVAASISGLLLNEKSREFSGFSGLFHRVAESFRESPFSPFGTKSRYSNLYREVYAAYL